MAARHGLRLAKSRVRDPRALEFGTYHLVNPKLNAIVWRAPGRDYGIELDQVERYLEDE